MLMRFLVFIVIGKLALTFYGISTISSCANILAPEGGIRDSIPPVVVQEESTPNFQTNFEKQVVELTFDEWVVLEDVFNQLIVSPPLEPLPELKLRKKTVKIEFDEKTELRTNATYTINLGEAVKDLNEKNPAENLRFVFSTGEVLDSLSVRGQVYDVLTNEPIEDAWFMLYENLADSVVRTEKPFYVAKTDKEGRCLIENVKADTFKVFALTETGRDYLFNQPGEQIAFLDTNFIIAPGNTREIKLAQFAETLPLTLSGNEVGTFGIAKLIFNRALDTVAVRYTAQNVSMVREIDKDTLKLWYGTEQGKAWRILVELDTATTDTIHVEALPKSEFLQANALRCEQNKKKIKINPTLPVKLKFNHPIQDWDTSLISVFEDSLKTVVKPQISRDSVLSRQLEFSYNWKEGVAYEFRFLPNAVGDIFSLRNDTISIDYEAQLIKEFGNINLNITGLDTSRSYVIHLLGSSNAITAAFQTSQTATFSQKLTTLKPGKYKVKIIDDRNANGKWDTGNYDLKIQPEKLATEELEQLRANWDLDVTIEWKP